MSVLWIFTSLVEMKKAGLEGCELKTLLRIIPGLLVWANMCLIEAHRIRRAEYLLSVLNKKNMELQVVLEETRRLIATDKRLVVVHADDFGRIFATVHVHMLVERLEKFVRQEDELLDEITEIEKAMKRVGEIIVVKAIEEPSIN